jgi:hypothetical protein
MKRIICAPESFEDSDYSIFLAGGISNCPDWQKLTAFEFVTKTPLDVLNPRRYNWNMDSQDEASIAQIEWEYAALRHATFTLFWFPEETLCPITLFELGSALERIEGRQLLVGCHPNYGRKLDVITQCRLSRPEIKVWESLEDMVASGISRWGS